MTGDHYQQRFSGIARLYGQRGLDNISRAHVAVIGVGGVGSWAVEALARSGIMKITMVDLDEICITNINRQLHAMDGEIGKQKTDAMTERIKRINPDCEVISLQTFYSERTADDILGRGFDFVIDAIDLLKQKTHLIAECHRRKIPIITCGGAGGKTDPTSIRVADITQVGNDGLMRKVRTQLRSHYGFPKAENNKKKKFKIECVYFDEPAVLPECGLADGEVATGKRLNCRDGYGSITHMTATQGLFAAQRALAHIVQQRV